MSSFFLTLSKNLKYSMEKNDKIAFIIHGKLKKLNLFINKIEQIFSKYEILIQKTQKAQDGILLTKEAIEKNYKFIIAVGGDGTMNEVINGVMFFDEAKRKEISVGLLPNGTGNDFARSIKMPNSLDDLFTLVDKRKTRPIDIGELKFITPEGKKGKRFFNNIADIGMGGLVVEMTKKNNKRLFNSNLTFMRTVMRAFRKYKHPTIRLSSPNFKWEGKIVSLCMANGKYFGSGFGIAPHAKIDDGKIALSILGNFSRWDYVMHLPKLRKCKKVYKDEAIYQKVKACKIEILEGESPIDLDGEFVGYPPLEARIIPSAIRFLRKV